MTEQLKPPRGLGVAGRRLWRDVAQECANDGLELTAQERFWLHSACKLTDQAAILEAALRDAPPRVKGSMGQLVADPLLAELRQLHLAASLTLARIKTDVPEASGVISINQPRQAANIRWRGKGA